MRAAILISLTRKANKEVPMATVGKIATAVAVMTVIGLIVVYEMPRLVKA